MNQEQNKRLNEIKNSAHPIILMVDEMIKKDNMLKILLNPETTNGKTLRAIHHCILSKITNPRYYTIINGVFTPMIILYEHDLIYREVMNLYIQGIASDIKKFEFKNNIGSPLRLNEFTKRHNATIS